VEASGNKWKQVETSGSKWKQLETNTKNRNNWKQIEKLRNKWKQVVISAKQVSARPARLFIKKTNKEATERKEERGHTGI
jgi:hypothetical protein